MKTNYLALSWSVSRGRDTYGYNICRLDDRETDKRYKCMGGGYDMKGTVFGDWLQDVYQERLMALASDPSKLEEAGYAVKGYLKHIDLYGITFYSGKATLDGACGLESMKRIAEAIGLEVTDNYNRRKRGTEGFFIMDSRT